MQVYFIDDFAMSAVSKIAFLLPLLFGAGAGPSGVAQEKPLEQATGPAPPALHLGYPDSAGGLEKFGKDIVKALKDGDSARAGLLIRSLLLADSKTWYAKVFGEANAVALSSKHEEMRKDIPAQLEVLFAKYLDERATSVSARRYEASYKDDNAGEFTFGVLQGRIEPIPLYELGFATSDRFYRLWALAYVDGGFRYVGDLRPPESFPRPRSPGTPNDNHGAPTEKVAHRITVGGNVVAAKLINRVPPHYPEVARREYLQGTVKLHAIIGKDGTIQRLGLERVLFACGSLFGGGSPLALSAYAAQWPAGRDGHHD